MSAFTTCEKKDGKDELTLLQENIFMLFSQENWLISEACQKLLGLKQVVQAI
jgi:hypothetical protein